MFNKSIPTLLGIFAITTGLVAGVLIVKKNQLIKIQAAEAAIPKNIRITNISDTSFSVSWTTSVPTVGFVKWKDDSHISSFEKESNIKQGATENHWVTIKDLSPQKTYKFIINSNGADFDNNGIPWQITTGPILPPTTGTHTISGTILDINGKPLHGVLVFAVVGGGSPLSTTTSENGNWVITISTSRAQNLTSYIPINENSPIELSIYSGDNFTSATVYLKDANNQFQILVGDVKQNIIRSNSSDELPEADITFPDTSQFPSFGNLLSE